MSIRPLGSQNETIYHHTSARPGGGLTFRPSDHTYLTPRQPWVRPHPLTYLRGLTYLPYALGALQRFQRVDPLEHVP